MLDKLQSIKERFEEVGQLIVLPESMADMSKYAKLTKEYKDLEKIVAVYDEYNLVLQNISSSKEILDKEKDPDFRDMAKAELEELKERKEELENELKQLLIPKDPNDSKDCILEIRGGTGGDEAAIFAGDLFRMYERFCEMQNWKLTVLDLTFGSAGGYKEIIATISGADVYGMMKYESGVHRVQRVPATESQGRVHTSAASVAVLPEMDEVEVHLDMNDIRKDTYCSSGPGGQSVNTTYSAVRLTHNPTGLVVTCQDEKSQIKNFEKALKVLRSRLYEIELAKHNESVGAQRKSMVGSGDRSDKIRTYNYPQSRVTDHRINKTVYNLPEVMDGHIEEFISALRFAENLEKMQSSGLEE
ncbi:MAG TPA: peptide chain release factor 1 [Algoriphagus sp.]|jgi:peptide chain release factor 1|uniref:peptide chain release factor 1 n=1 Tax=Algoriphagus TaxID=246875 RepID=UPI000C641DC0|nr:MULTISPECIES: peptide chain release factor 1 [Algoriphagus]MAL15999.1 peptide chain release factor 1 [Algoriphagus sp.]QYH40617.1 peptide chain release factor 1 [Algoriphagus sp. NBT04N3]HAS60861.1 peptide chain release factor 1 [Algoriphagus sp.]HCD88708.1 peptide chain release factor 1 [Algoriphagus sp.]HCH45585.1 peptide chain release factor 1 [Algoriphagus sp.]|tara:strand:+ start:124 stop:1200 length:1077 start_codon:yes stop_codon:yes gene_type:complete